MNTVDSVGSFPPGPEKQSEVHKFFTEIGDDWSKFCSSDQLAAIQEATEGLKEAYPWLCATPEQARSVAVCAVYPRSRLGARQADWLLRAVYAIQQRCPDINSAAREIIEMVTARYEPVILDEWITYAPEGSFFWLVGRLCKSLGFDGSFQPKNGSELFAAIAERFAYLESYKPTAGDYAIEALQGAFVGQMQSAYAWGKKGLPTKGDAIEMAKARLQERKKKSDFAKSCWSELLKAAQLDWLPAGQAGRPSKAMLDENKKAERRCKAILTRAVNEQFNGNWVRMVSSMETAYGNSAERRRIEEERLRARDKDEELE